MKIMPYTDVTATHIDNPAAKGVAARVVIGKNDGAENFCMRIFEIAAGGHTPRHSHDWEHEIFVHSGAGEMHCNGRIPSKPGVSRLYRPMRNIRLKTSARSRSFLRALSRRKRLNFDDNGNALTVIHQV